MFQVLSYCDGKTLLKLSSLSRGDRLLLKFSHSQSQWDSYGTIFGSSACRREWDTGIQSIWSIVVHREFLSDKSREWVQEHICRKRFALNIPLNVRRRLPKLDYLGMDGIEGIKDVFDSENALISHNISLMKDSKPIWVLWNIFQTFAEVLSLPNRGQNTNVFKGMSDIIRGYHAWDCVLNGLAEQKVSSSVIATVNPPLEKTFDQFRNRILNISDTTANGFGEKAMLQLYGLLINRNGQKSCRNHDLGLFGGTEVYSARSILWFLDDERMQPCSKASLTIATAFGSSVSRTIQLKLETGELEKSTEVPTRRVQSICSGNADLIEWFHEYGRRLRSGFFQSFPLLSDASILRVRSKFPQCPPFMSTAITRGIKITMSKTRRYDCHLPTPAFWQYEIAIRLLSAGEPGYVSPEERGFDTAQLLSRYWVLEMVNGTTQVVDDFGVVGLYPLLRDRSFTSKKTGSHYISYGLYSGPEREEEGEFRYCSQLYADVKYFGGHLCFVPGCLDKPTGERFQATVARNEMISLDMSW